MAPQVGVGFTYLIKVETSRLDFGDYPSEALMHRLAEALDADEEELLLLADKVPNVIRQRIRQKPEAFRRLARLDDSSLDLIAAQLED